MERVRFQSHIAPISAHMCRRTLFRSGCELPTTQGESTQEMIHPVAINPNRLCGLDVEHGDIPLNQDVKSEQFVAITDLLEENYFEVVGLQCGPYKLMLSTRASRLSLQITTMNRVPVATHIISFTPFQRIIRDYLIVCEAHSRAVVGVDRYRIEAVDMARRAIHNEGSDLLKERLSAKVNIDPDTARRLFTIIVTPFMASACLMRI